MDLAGRLEGGTDPQTALASAVETRDLLPPGEIGVQRGESVHASDGEVGKVEGLVVDSAQGHVTHVLLQEGHLWGRKEVAIPISSVVSTRDGIRLRISKQEVQDLPAVDVGHPGA